MSFNFCGGDTEYDDTVGIGDLDGLDTDNNFSDNFEDASWNEASDIIDTDTIFETAFDIDDDVCDGQLSFFESDTEDMIEVDVTAIESSLDTDSSSDNIEGQVDFEEFLDYQQDLHHTPSYDSSLGQWSGMRGDSLFIPSDTEAQRILNELGLEGIAYKEAQPDFSDVTAATVYLSQQDMEELGDAEQKAMAMYTLADDLVDEESEDADEVTEYESDVNMAIIKAVLGEEEIDEFYAALLSGDVPASFVLHHGDLDADCDYSYELIPTAIHDACRHRGGRSHSGTER